MSNDDLSLADVFCIVEVDEAEPFVGDLFRRRFGTPLFPDQPRHFVGFALLPDGSSRAVGYVHYDMWESSALIGGLVIDERNYRRLPQPVRNVLRSNGGIAERMLAETFERMPPDTLAIWGYVGSKMSEKVCLRVGLERIDAPYLMVSWRQGNLDEATKREWIERAISLGPF